MEKEKVKQNLKLNYSVPITEFNKNPLSKDFVIEGIAINATTTTNNHKFIPEELEKSAHTLQNVPLLEDHKNEIDSC